MEYCDFCEMVNVQKFLVEQERQKKKADRLNRQVTVALVVHMWTKERGKRNAIGSTYYKSRGWGYKLNYCPECGKKLTKEG